MSFAWTDTTIPDTQTAEYFFSEIDPIPYPRSA
jgi:hypothetical protein